MFVSTTWSANGNVLLLSGLVPVSDTYRWTIIVSSFRQIEQGAYHRKALIYSTRKADLEHAVVELVHKFDEKSTESV